MSIKLAQLDNNFIAHVADGDVFIEDAIRNLNYAAEVFHKTYVAKDIELPQWSSIKHDGGNQVDHALLDLTYLQRLQGRQLGELLLELIDALTHYRLRSATLVARAAVETCAVIVYSEDRIVRQINDLNNPPSEQSLDQIIDSIHQLVNGGRFDWFTWHHDPIKILDAFGAASNANEEPSPKGTERAINIMTMIQKLDIRVSIFLESIANEKRNGIVRSVYAQLSDHCHPAIGAATLSVGDRPTNKYINLTSNITSRTVRKVFDSMLSYIAPMANVADISLITIGTAAQKLRTLGPSRVKFEE